MPIICTAAESLDFLYGQTSGDIYQNTIFLNNQGRSLYVELCYMLGLYKSDWDQEQLSPQLPSPVPFPFSLSVWVYTAQGLWELLGWVVIPTEEGVKKALVCVIWTERGLWSASTGSSCSSWRQKGCSNCSKGRGLLHIKSACPVYGDGNHYHKGQHPWN